MSGVVLGHPLKGQWDMRRGRGYDAEPNVKVSNIIAEPQLYNIGAAQITPLYFVVFNLISNNIPTMHLFKTSFLLAVSLGRASAADVIVPCLSRPLLE